MQSVCMATSRQDIWSPVGALVEAVALSAVAKISAWVTNMLTSTPGLRLSCVCCMIAAAERLRQRSWKRILRRKSRKTVALGLAF